MIPPRAAFADALWASDLRPLERLVALAYADHARAEDAFAWVTYSRLMERTGMSRDAVSRALRGLVAAGWLEVKEPASQHRSARYWLRIPSQRSGGQTAGDAQASVSQAAESHEPVDNSISGSGDGPLIESSSPSPVTSSPSPVTSSPGDGLNHLTHPPTDRLEGGGAREDRSQAVAAVIATHGDKLDEHAAIAAVDAIAAWSSTKDGGPIRSLVSFVKNRSLEDLQRWAGKPHTPKKPAGPQTIPNRCPDCGHPVAADDRSCACPAPRERAS